MPIVNINTGKIVGAEKNSLTYWHEKGHIVFSDTNQGILYNYCADAFVKFAVIILIINSFFNNLWINVFNLSLALCIIYFYIYEELWCWNYAYTKKEKKNG